MPVYRPRMYARLYVPSAGTTQARVAQDQNPEVFQLDVRPLRARYVANDYREADELELTFSHDDAGLDPRILGSAEVYFYMGNAAEDGTFTPGYENLRFIGIVRTVDRDFGPNGRFVHVRALDYTTLFLEMKSFPPAGIPDLSQTLQSAWERICDHTGYWDLTNISAPTVVSSVQALKKSLQLVNVPASLTLGAAMPARIAKLGKLQVPHNADAWAVWRFATESLGLISFVRGNRVIVTNALDYYTADDPPRMVWGKNVTELYESRDQGALSSKGVCMRSFDPLGGRTLEAFWPPPSKRSRKKKLAASGTAGKGTAVLSQDYVFYEAPFPCADQAKLQVMTQRAYEERSRQELSGHMRIVDMFVDTVEGARFDVLKLQSGDVINVEIDREGLGMIQKLPTIGQRAAFLRDWGFSAQMVQYIVNNLDAIVRMPPQFLVRTVDTTMEEPSGDGGGGTYETRIEFINRIHVDGSATSDGTGTREPPMEDQTEDD